MDVPPPRRAPLPIPWRRVAVVSGKAVGAVVGVVGAVGIFLYATTTTTHHPKELMQAIHAQTLLDQIVDAETRYRDAATVDEDGDGVGEYGGFLEMTCGTTARGHPDERVAPYVAPRCPGPGPHPPPPPPTTPPARTAVLETVFDAAHADGSFTLDGYRYRLHLTARDGTTVAETLTDGFGDGWIDPDAAERRFVCYAWPDVRLSRSQPAFVVDETGTIWACWSDDYFGAAGPAPGAALSSGGLQSIAGSVAPDVPAQDGNVWRRAR